MDECVGGRLPQSVRHCERACCDAVCDGAGDVLKCEALGFRLGAVYQDFKSTRRTTIALTVLACSLAVLCLIVYAVAMGNVSLMQADLRIDGWWHARVAEPWISLMVLASALGRPVTVIAGAACVAFMLLWRHRRFPPFWLWASVPLAVLGNQVLKRTVERHRPVFDQPLQTLESYSFPSGHAVGATVFYGLLTLWIVATRRSREARLIAALAGGLVVATISFSRIYLGVHFPSDVAAGVSEGLVWLALCVILTRYGASNDVGGGIVEES